MNKKLSLETLRVVSFQTNVKPESQLGGATLFNCGTNFQNCDTGEPLLCGTNLAFCPVSEAQNCTGNCTYIC